MLDSILPRTNMELDYHLSRHEYLNTTSLRDKVGVNCIDDPARFPEVDVTPKDGVCELPTRFEINGEVFSIFRVVFSHP